MKNWVSIAIVAVILSLANMPASACSACFGQSDSRLAVGMNMGILTLLFVVLGVLGGIASFFIYLARRSAKYPQPGTDQFTENPTKA